MSANGSGKTVIVGAGLMGAQIGAEYALGGFRTVLVTRSAGSGQKALGRARDAIRYLAENDLVTEGAARVAVDRLTTALDVSRACAGARIVIESVAEALEPKREVLRTAAQAAPDAILASNTSSLSIAALGEASGAAERMIGTHYWNPPTLMPLVEVVSGPATLDSVRDEVISVLRALRKEPVVVADVPGFVWNRLQFALLREAAALVADRVAAPEVIDTIVRKGLGRRWSQVGPFETMALGGRDTFVRIATELFPDLATTTDAEYLQRVPLPDAATLLSRLRERDRALAQWARSDLESAGR